MNDLPVPNLPLLRKVLDHIDAHPEQHNQFGFAIEEECGTVACFAGWTLALTVGLEKRGDALWPQTAAADADRGDAFMEGAQHELGLTTREAERLFLYSTDRAGVQATCERIAARAGERL